MKFKSDSRSLVLQILPEKKVVSWNGHSLTNETGYQNELQLLIAVFIGSITST